MMCPPNAVHASCRKPGFFTAAVPMIDVGDTVVEILLDRVEVADPAAELHRDSSRRPP